MKSSSFRRLFALLALCAAPVHAQVLSISPVLPLAALSPISLPARSPAAPISLPQGGGVDFHFEKAPLILPSRLQMPVINGGVARSFTPGAALGTRFQPAQKAVSGAKVHTGDFGVVLNDDL